MLTNATNLLEQMIYIDDQPVNLLQVTICGRDDSGTTSPSITVIISPVGTSSGNRIALVTTGNVVPEYKHNSISESSIKRNIHLRPGATALGSILSPSEYSIQSCTPAEL